MLEWKYQLPSLHQVKKFKLPDSIPPMWVRCYITISAATHYCYAGSVSFKYTILYVVNFISHFSLPWKQQFFFVTQCKQIDICKFPYSVMQTLPVVFSTEVRYFMGGSGTLIADVHLSCSTTLEAQLRSSADFAWWVKLKAFILYGIG